MTRATSRCHGSLNVASVSGNGTMYVPCPSRDRCLRYVARATYSQYTSWILAEPDETGRCCAYMIPIPEQDASVNHTKLLVDDYLREFGEIETMRDLYHAPPGYWD